MMRLREKSEEQSAPAAVTPSTFMRSKNPEVSPPTSNTQRMRGKGVRVPGTILDESTR